MAMFTRTAFPVMSLLLAMLLALTTWDVVSASSSLGDDFYEVSTPQRMSYFAKLASGETVDLLSYGPFTITARCNSYDEASLLATVTAEDEDEWVFGFPDYERRDGDGLCIGLTAAGDSSFCEMFRSGSGTEFPSGLQSLSGYYVGVVGHTIGFDIDYMSDSGAQIYSQYTEDDLAAFPSDQYKCMIAGVLEYFA